MKQTIISLLCLLLASGNMWAADYQKYYQNLPVKVAQVEPFTIPANEVSIADCGGVGDGVSLNTEAFAKAISRLSKVGGGRVVVPDGVWLTGPISLKDNIELHLHKNAIIYFSPDKRLYQVEKSGADRVYPCIRASKRTNIAITGEGIIDGNGGQWRPVKRGKQSDVEWKQYLEMGGQVADDGNLWYPWQMKNGFPDIADSPKAQEGMRNDLIRFTDCVNVLIEGVTVQNAPRFHVHPCNSRNVVVDGVTVRCPWNAQNGDAIDFSDVNVGLIVNCVVDAGDDGICMKSSAAKAQSPANGCEDIVVQDNTVFHAHGGFVLGSNTVSGIRRVVVRRNRFSGTDTGLRFKSSIGRGGKTEQLYISDIVMSDIKDEAIVFQCDYVDNAAGRENRQSAAWKEPKNVPDFQDIHIENVVCRGCKTGIRAQGIAQQKCVHDIYISRATIVYDKTAKQIDEETASLTCTDVQLIGSRSLAAGKSSPSPDRVVYCSYVSSGKAALGTDYCELSATPGGKDSVKVVLNDDSRFAEKMSASYEVSASDVERLQQALSQLPLDSIAHYQVWEEMRGGTEYGVKVRYASGRTVDASWYTHSPRKEAVVAYQAISRFFAPWREQLTRSKKE